MSYLIDSNVVINYVAETYKPKSLTILDTVFDLHFNFSVITFMEVLGFNIGEEDATIFRRLFESGKQVDIDHRVIAQTIKIRKQVKIKLPDAIIAASAFCFNLQLVTENMQDFSKVAGLKAIEPRKIL